MTLTKPLPPSPAPPRGVLLALGEVSSTDDLARYLQVPKKTVYAWNSAGTGPRLVRIGKYVRYRREDVQAWLAERAGTS